MFGAILGDIIGSPYEFDANNIKTKDFPLFGDRSKYTDDSVMTIAVANGILSADDKYNDEEVRKNIILSMRAFGSKYPYAGYGGRFSVWLDAEEPEPYNSYGNGSAMRVSSVAWIYDTIEDVRRFARISAEVTHNHPEGIKGAEATAAAVFLARQGCSKGYIKNYIVENFGYDLSRTCDEIRPDYHHVESCQETVPEAITAFLEGTGFEDVLRTAVSLGGDCDTLTAIAGSIAEAYYGISQDWKYAALSRLPNELAQVLRQFDIMYGINTDDDWNLVHKAVRFAEKAHRGQKRKGTQSDYIIHPMEVYSILQSMDASPELLAAGVLHDTIEDTETTIDDIYEKFGERVAYLVKSISEDKTKSWQERKEHTLDMLMNAERDVKLLSLADKVSNLRCMLYDYQRIGDELWDRFNASREMQRWYYSYLNDVLADLKNDVYARNAYWEMVALFKDLFIEFFVDLKNDSLYQISGDYIRFIFTRSKITWERFEGELAESAVPISRQKAERLEDYWKNLYYDDDTEDNIILDEVLNSLSEEREDYENYHILQLIKELAVNNSHFLIPVVEDDNIDSEDNLYQRLTELENGENAAVAFTNMLEAEKGPETQLITAGIEEIMVKNKGGLYSGIIINPWGNSFYIPMEWVEKLLKDIKKAK